MYRSECNDNDKRTLQNSASSGLRSVADQQVSNLKNQCLLANNIYVTTTSRNFQDLLFTHSDEVNL